MHVKIVPCLQDNYAYLLVDEASRTGNAAWPLRGGVRWNPKKKDVPLGFAIDPVEPPTVQAAASDNKVEIVRVLATHKHADHSGGNAAMAKTLGVPVHGGSEAVAAVTNILEDGTLLQVLFYGGAVSGLQSIARSRTGHAFSLARSR